MQAEGTAQRGVVVASGYGLKVRVHRGHLLVEDGAGTCRQTRRFNRATGGLERLVVLGGDGFVTLEALTWLRDTGAAFVQLDHDGRPVALSAAPGPSLPALRRAQALARDRASGIEIARIVLAEKLRGQASVAEQLPDEAAGHALTAAHRTVEAATTLGAMVAAEAAGAGAYWDAWSTLPVRFAKRELHRTPEHWLAFGQRHSPLSRSTRRAINPANAALNYLYALLEAETTIACHAAGLDPVLGIFHTDKPARASLALDLMEAARPAVDAYVLRLLRERTFARDFTETPQGGCRILPALARHLATTATAWRDRIAPVVDLVAQQLVLDTGQPIATRLTAAKRSAAWTARRGSPTKTRPVTRPELPRTCRMCGTSLTDRRRRECESCKRERTAQVAVTGRQAAAGVLARLRDAGQDPAHGGEAARQRGAKNAAHQRALLAWNERQDGEANPAAFLEEIQPRLRELPIARLVETTGLSAHYCSLIRLGKRVPHPRHWAPLRALADAR